MPSPAPPSRSPPPGLAAVVDSHPRFWCEFVLWLLCANKHFAGPKRVYFIGGTPAALIAFARERGCDIRQKETLLPAAPHCNKLIPFLDPDGFANQIVTDTDLFLLRDISIFFREDRVRLPPNNGGIPPLPLFAELFTAIGLPDPPEPGLSLIATQRGNRETYAGNVSTGVIAIPAALKSFATAWRDRAEWLLSSPVDLKGCRGHIDQISCALAVAETGTPFSHLPPQTNTVLHLLPQIQTLYGLHLSSGHIPLFPDRFGPGGILRREGVSNQLAPQLDAFNALLSEARRIITGMPDLAAFGENFLNPRYRRPD